MKEKRASSRRKKTEIAPAKKAEVRKSVKKNSAAKTEDEFPGYPYYAPDKDIMNPKNKIVKEELTETSGKFVNSFSQKIIRVSREEIMERPVISFEEEIIEIETETDLTKEEKQLLESDELSEDLGEDEELRTRVWAVDMTGEDLDVPGTELDDEAEEVGSEDEENNLYSIGGDRHEGLEEDHDRGT